MRKHSSNYDLKTGQKLYEPRITPIEISKKNIEDMRSRPSLKTQAYFIKEGLKFVEMCQQIFDFLCLDDEAVVYTQKLTDKDIHPTVAKLLGPILDCVVDFED